ncbi:hypothetical protein AHAS_Ahas18G0226300 [Arachis hypogaea]
MRLSLILRLLTLRFFGKIKRQALLGNLNNNNAASNKSNGVKLLSFFVHLSIEWELATSEKVEAAPVEVKKPKKMDAGDGDVDIGDEMPMSTFPHVEIEKDKEVAGGHAISSSSSSSNSSSDSSSSSDSDSASSSKSDYEAWPMCGVPPKKMICFTASFECATLIHG